MSNSNSASMGFLARINSGSTKGIFIIFTLVFIIVSVLFFLLLNYSQRNKSEKLIEVSHFSDQVISQKNSLEAEAQNSLRSSLLFNVSNKEIDRFQAIYSLKATKDQYEKYKNSSLKYSSGDEFSGAFVELQRLLADYDQMIAESINKDGRLVEILQSTLQEDDSIKSTLLLDEANIGIHDGEAKALDQALERGDGREKKGRAWVSKNLDSVEVARRFLFETGVA